MLLCLPFPSHRLISLLFVWVHCSSTWTASFCAAFSEHKGSKTANNLQILKYLISPSPCLSRHFFISSYLKWRMRSNSLGEKSSWSFGILPPLSSHPLEAQPGDAQPGVARPPSSPGAQGCPCWPFHICPTGQIRLGTESCANSHAPGQWLSLLGICSCHWEVRSQGECHSIDSTWLFPRKWS